MAYSAWASSTSYAVGAIVRASTLQASGLVFRCTVAGTSASTQPTWPTDIGSTIADGGVTWAAISSVYEELAVLAPNAIIELFQLTLDATLQGSSTTYYFHAGANAAVTGNIVWNGNQYVRLPIQVEGFDYASGGTLPRPTLSIANLGGEISALILLGNAVTPGNDLGGAKITRIRTLKKFLDGEAGADPHAKFPDEIWYVDRKSAETRDVVQWELASKLDMAGMMIPKRQLIANICQWQYLSSECGYDPIGPSARPLREHYAQFGYTESRNINSTGQFNATYYLATYADVAAVYTLATANEHYRNYGIWEGRLGNAGGMFDANYYLNTYPDLNPLVYFNQNDQGVASSANDSCGKRLSSCKLRFGNTAQLSFGSFPGVGLTQ